MSRTRMTTLPFLLLALSPFVIFDGDNPLISYPLGKSKIPWKRMTTLPFLLLALSPFDSDYALISCPLCKSNKL